MGASLHVLFVLLGGFSILSQTVVLREYLVAYGGNELALGLFFGSWLAWIGVGAIAAGRLVRRLDPRRMLPALALVYCATPLGQTALIRSLRLLAGVPPMEPFPVGELLVVTALSNMPLSLLTGMIFTVGAALVSGRSTSGAVSRAYLLEAAGGFAGGALATLLPAWDVSPTSMLLGGCAAMAAGALAVSLGRSRLLGAAAAAACLAALALLLTPAGEALSRATERQRWRATLPEAELVRTFDTPYRNVSLARLGDQRIVLFDGRIAQVYPGGSGVADDAALMMAEARGARRVLLLGLTSASLVREILAYEPASVTLVEPDGEMLERTVPFLPREARRALTDPRVELVRADPRAWIQGPRARFDLIVLRMPDPDTAQLNRFYTVQFHRFVERALSSSGVYTTSVTSAENFLGTEVERYGRSIHRSLEAVFAEVAIKPGEDAVFFAAPSAGTLTEDPGELERRYGRIAASSPGFDPGRFGALMEPERVAFVRSVYDSPPAAGIEDPLNTDMRPVAYINQLTVMGRTVGSELPEVIDAARTAGLWLALLPLAVAFVMRVRHVVLFSGAAARRRGDSATFVATAGFVSISLCIVLLHGFQNRFGSMFLEVGLMNALFMAGLSVGALGGRAVLDRARRRLPVVAAVGAGVTLFAAGLPAALSLDPGRVGFAALFASLGLLTGAAFPAAGSLHPVGRASSRETGSLASLLESSDHVGGALGGVLGGVLLLPLLGVRDACLVLAAAAAAALALVCVDWPALLPDRALLAARHAARRAAFPWHGLSALLAGLTLASLGLGLLVRSRAEGERERFSAVELEAIAPDAEVELRRRPFVHYRLAPGTPGGGVLLSSRTVASGIKGYGGPIDLALLIRRDGTIDDVQLRDSDETPAYVEGIRQWLHDSFVGRPVGRDFFLRSRRGESADDPHGVDVLTGATITSRAVVSTVNATKNAAARLMDLEVQRRPGPSPWTRYAEPRVVYLLVAMALAFVVTAWGFPGSSPWPRRAFLALNLVLGGIVFNVQLSMEHVIRALQLRLPSLDNAELVVLMGGTALLAVAVGPLYCANLCPFGAAQELLALLGMGVRPSRHLERKTRYVRYVVLALLVGAWMLTGSRSVISADPLVHVFSGKLSGVMLTLVVAVALISVFSFRFWCRTFCPVGALLSLGGRVAVALRLVPDKRYGLCDLGARTDRDGECLHCNRCLTGSTLTAARMKARRWAFGARNIDRWTRLAVAGVGIVFAAAVLSPSPPLPGAEDSSSGRPRDVRVDRIRELIQEDRLSDHEALYWHPLEEQEPPADGPPPSGDGGTDPSH